VAAVLGLGETGGAIASALRGSELFASVVGWDPDFDAARAAQRRNVADRFAGSAAEAARQAAVVFIALRGEAFVETLTAIGPNLKAGAVACSLLEAHEVANAVAARTLPASVSFLNADPIRWEPPDLRRGMWCVSSTPSAHADAVGFIAQVGERLEMEPLFLDAREHDALSAGTRLMPAVLATALLRVATAQASWREMSRLAGSELRVATAPLEGGAADLQEQLSGAREHAVRWLDLLVEELTRLREGLQDGQEATDYFQVAEEARAKWLHQREIPAQAADLPRIETQERRRFPF
jgi:prephenate dehydrogenase